MRAVSLMKNKLDYYDKKRDTIFPCEHEVGEGKTMGRCAACRMPVEKDELKLDLMNSTAVFCCDECKKHYVNSLIELKIIY